MPDLLTHALVAYIVCTLLSWHYEWLTASYVTVGMAGAFAPDLVKINLVISALEMRQLLSMPFSWTPLHTLGGALVSVAVGVVLVRHAERRRVAPLLVIGAATHLVADSFLRTPTGEIGPLLWPFWGMPLRMPGFYLSTDPWPTAVAAGTAVLVAVATRRRRSDAGGSSTRD